MWDYSRPTSTPQYNYAMPTAQLPTNHYRTHTSTAPIKIHDDAYGMDVMCMNCQRMISVEEIGNF